MVRSEKGIFVRYLYRKIRKILDELTFSWTRTAELRQINNYKRLLLQDDWNKEKLEEAIFVKEES